MKEKDQYEYNNLGSPTNIQKIHPYDLVALFSLYLNNFFESLANKMP